MTWMIPFDFPAASRYRFRREDSHVEIIAMSAHPDGHGGGVAFQALRGPEHVFHFPR